MSASLCSHSRLSSLLEAARRPSSTLLASQSQPCGYWWHGSVARRKFSQPSSTKRSSHRLDDGRRRKELEKRGSNKHSSSLVDLYRTLAFFGKALPFTRFAKTSISASLMPVRAGTVMTSTKGRNAMPPSENVFKRNRPKRLTGSRAFQGIFSIFLAEVKENVLR